MYVIRYSDGAYNQGSGFPCNLEEATVYSGYAEAMDAAIEIVGPGNFGIGAVLEPYTPAAVSCMWEILVPTERRVPPENGNRFYTTRYHRVWG